ncbi:MAG: hypothetical protein MZV64_32985 [Ignavibacteriales bacterium]|nr:hypothetical protein [Ignavibacteriales bacterium]
MTRRPQTDHQRQERASWIRPGWRDDSAEPPPHYSHIRRIGWRMDTTAR